MCEAGLLVDCLGGYGSGVIKGESRQITGNWKSGALLLLKCDIRISNISTECMLEMQRTMEK